MKCHAAGRMQRVAESGTVRMGNLEREMKAKGIKIISFALGEPDFDTPAHIKDAAIESLRSGFTHYTASKGILELRQAIAEKSKRENGINCTPDEVLVTPTKLGIYEAITAFVEDGDEVVVPDPGWSPMSRWSTSPAEGRQRPPEGGGGLPHDAREGPRGHHARTTMILLNSPSNPTGTVMTEADFRGIAELARDHNLLVLTDEIYEKLVYEGKHVSIAAMDGMYERTITLNGFSKSYAMTDGASAGSSRKRTS